MRVNVVSAAQIAPLFVLLRGREPCMHVYMCAGMDLGVNICFGLNSACCWFSSDASAAGEVLCCCPSYNKHVVI